MKLFQKLAHAIGMLIVRHYFDGGKGMKPYQKLAYAVVVQAISDYRNAAKKIRKFHAANAKKSKKAAKKAENTPNYIKNERTLYDCKKFFLSEHFELFTELDGKKLLAKLQEKYPIPKTDNPMSLAHHVPPVEKDDYPIQKEDKYLEKIQQLKQLIADGKNRKEICAILHISTRKYHDLIVQNGEKRKNV